LFCFVFFFILLIVKTCLFLAIKQASDVQNPKSWSHFAYRDYTTTFNHVKIKGNNLARNTFVVPAIAIKGPSDAIPVAPFPANPSVIEINK
jgi:hypothetical protein